MASLGCPICKAANVTVEEQSGGVDSFQINCPICGSYALAGSALTMLTNRDKDFELSYAIRRRNLRKEKVYVNTVNRGELMAGIEIPKRIKDIAEQILKEVYLNEELSANGLVITDDNMSLYAIENMNKLRSVLQYLEDSGWFKLERLGSGGGFLTIKGAGTDHAEMIINPNHHSKQVFVAMSFNPVLDTLYTAAIQEAVKHCQLSALRSKDFDFNDEVIKNIQFQIDSSRFVIADFTDNRPGVYYEAGYATGRNLPVIYCCRESDKVNIHFDIYHFNFIFWSELDDLKSALIKRITNTELFG